jgi:hypothetical protein
MCQSGMLREVARFRRASRLGSTGSVPTRQGSRHTDCPARASGYRAGRLRAVLASWRHLYFSQHIFRVRSEVAGAARTTLLTVGPRYGARKCHSGAAGSPGRRCAAHGRGSAVCQPVIASGAQERWATERPFAPLKGDTAEVQPTYRIYRLGAAHVLRQVTRDNEILPRSVSDRLVGSSACGLPSR